MKGVGKDANQSTAKSTWERIQALKRIVPRAKVEEILKRCGKAGSYCRRLPNWLVVWFVIGMGLFCRDSYRQVFRWLGRRSDQGTPGRSTLCMARLRLGIRPLQLLADAVVRLLGTLSTPGAFYRGLRLMAVDGFVVDVFDSPANERAFGRPSSGRAPGAFPQARVLALCETGSHVLWRWLIKPLRCGEITMVHYLLRFLDAGMLLLWDRNFLSYRTLLAVTKRKAQLLARIKRNLVFRPLQRFADGSFLAKMYPSTKARRHDRDGIVVRIIEYTFSDPGRSGSGEKHRLLTTLLDPSLDPALELICLYHQRWEQEQSFDELKTHQRERAVLRSQTPAGVVQELHGLLLGHYMVRTLMFDAAATVSIDPRRLSFTNSLKILRCRLPEAPSSRRALRRWRQRLLVEVAEEILEERRPRINPRVIKRKVSNWLKKRPEHRNNPQPTMTFRDGIVMLN